MLYYYQCNFLNILLFIIIFVDMSVEVVQRQQPVNSKFFGKEFDVNLEPYVRSAKKKWKGIGITFSRESLRCTEKCFEGPLVAFFGSRRLQTFFKISVLQNFALCTGKHLCWGLFFNKAACLKPLLEKDSSTGAFLWILQNF